jgi:signal-transduction protein with cAMP-binding, CBS, and nucleotidyltransferase domain
MAKGSGGGIVGRARRRGGVVDIGQLSKRDKQQLRAAIRAGKVVRTTIFGRYPTPKPWYIGA